MEHVSPEEGEGPPEDGFGALAALDEICLPPGGVLSLVPSRECEIVTYLYKGALAQSSSMGSSGLVLAGEFQRMTSGPGIRHKELNGSSTDEAHVFRVTLHASQVGPVCAHEHKRFAAAQRHNRLCIVASPDGRKGSLRILQDALVFSSLLDPGHHMIHELLPGRGAWLHVIVGEVALQDLILCAGDGVGVTTERSVSVTAKESAEILLVDVDDRARGWGTAPFGDGASR